MPEVGHGPPPRSLTSPITNLGPIVATEEPLVESSNRGGLVSNQGISSITQIRGLVIDLHSQMNKYAIRVLIDSGAAGNFVSEDLLIAWNLKLELEPQYEELTLADG